jgi:hypothetical protein
MIVPARSWIATALLAALFASTVPASGAPGVAERNRPALAIYRPAPVTPAETAGADLAPTVKARLKVDARGRVAAVTVSQIDPSTRFDELFRRAAADGLRWWRFRPALSEGKPVPAEVPVSIRFEPRTAGRVFWTVPSLSLLLMDSDRELRRQRVLLLPEQERLDLLESIARQAEARIEPERRTEAESDHFLIVTDAATPGAARRILENLEAAYAVNREMLARRIPFQTARGKVRAYAYASRRQYASLAVSIDAFEWSAGVYHPVGLIAFHTEWRRGEQALAVLIHEATHALMDRHVARPGVSLPAWLDEGLATYLAYSRIREGRLIPGGKDRWLDDLVFVPPTGNGEVPSRPRSSFTLAELIDSTYSSFRGERRERYYEDAWHAVHFLRHGAEDWAEDRFPRFVLFLAEGYEVRAAFRQVYGMEPSELEGAFRNYVKDL